jgi:hypothetical protein
MGGINMFSDRPLIKDFDVEEFKRSNLRTIEHIDGILKSGDISDGVRKKLIDRRNRLEGQYKRAVEEWKFSNKYRRSGDYKTGTKLEGKMGKHEDVWRAETELPEFDITLDDPTNKYRHHDVALTEMSPDEFLRGQYEQFKATVHDTEPLSYEDYLECKSPAKVEYYKDILEGKRHKPVKGIYGPDSKLPITVLEYNVEGKSAGFQEGFHRGMAAKEAGLERMPVLIAVKHVREEI